MIGTAEHLRDPEREVVGDGRELVRRGPVRAEEGRSLEPDRTVASRIAPFSSARAGRRGVESARSLWPQRALVPADPEPVEVRQDRVLAPADGARGIRVVDAQNEHAASLVREPPVGDGGQRIADVERPRRAGREADADAHASIVT